MSNLKTIALAAKAHRDTLNEEAIRAEHTAMREQMLERAQHKSQEWGIDLGDASDLPF